MTKTRFSIVAGALLLGVIGVFATHPAKKSLTVTATFRAGGDPSVAGRQFTSLPDNSSNPGTMFYTATNTGHLVFLKTTNSGIIATLMTSGGAQPIYVKVQP